MNQRENTLMNIQSSGLRGLIAAVLIIAAAAASCGCKRKSSTAQDKTSQRHVPVEVAMIQRENLAVTKTYSGSLEGEEQANLVAKIPERVTAIKIQVGDRIAQGQICIALDKSGSTSQYFQAEANFNNAEKTLVRMKSLFGEGAISQQALDGAQTAFDIAKANFESARNTVELSSPISGIVTALNVTIGDLANPGSVLATVARNDRMKVIFNLNETDVADIAIGQNVQIIADSRPDAVAEGTIAQFFKSADTRSRSFEVRALFPNTNDHWFRPGMYVKVKYEHSPRMNVLTVPNAAIQSNGDSRRVFAVRNGRAFAVEVSLGVANDAKSEILNGLAERDTVVVVGASDLQDSTLVAVANPSK
jgi:membrane fusion protein, multidrug efflux system